MSRGYQQVCYLTCLCRCIVQLYSASISSNLTQNDKHIWFTPCVLCFLFFTSATSTTRKQTLLLCRFDVVLQHDAFVPAHTLHLQMVQHVDMILISISFLVGLHSAFCYCCGFACQGLFYWTVFESCASVSVWFDIGKRPHQVSLVSQQRLFHACICKDHNLWA